MTLVEKILSTQSPTWHPVLNNPDILCSSPMPKENADELAKKINGIIMDVIKSTSTPGQYHLVCPTKTIEKHFKENCNIDSSAVTHPIYGLDHKIIEDPSKVQKSLKTQAERAIEQQKQRKENVRWNNAELAKSTHQVTEPVQATSFLASASIDNRGKSLYNEDACGASEVKFKIGEKETTAKLFIIADGHGKEAVFNQNKIKTSLGKFCANYAVDNLGQKLESQLSQQLKKLSEEQQLDDEWVDLAISNSLKLAFVDISEALESEKQEIGKQFSREQLGSNGTTLTAVLFFNNTLWTACAGDSPALLACSSKETVEAIPLSLNANPQNPHDSEDSFKINRSSYNRGAIIGKLPRSETWRCGNYYLAVARSLGHGGSFPIKENEATPLSGINPRPTITKTVLNQTDPNANEQYFLILSTDGFSTTASDEQIAKQVIELKQSGKTLKEIAEEFVRRSALSLSSDDITLLIAELKKT